MNLAAYLRMAEGVLDATHIGATNPTVRVTVRVLQAAVAAARRLADGGLSVTDIVSEMDKIRPHNRQSIDTAIDELAKKFPADPDDVDTNPGE